MSTSPSDNNNNYSNIRTDTSCDLYSLSSADNFPERPREDYLQGLVNYFHSRSSQVEEEAEDLRWHLSLEDTKQEEEEEQTIISNIDQLGQQPHPSITFGEEEYSGVSPPVFSAPTPNYATLADLAIYKNQRPFEALETWEGLNTNRIWIRQLISDSGFTSNDIVDSESSPGYNSTFRLPERGRLIYRSGQDPSFRRSSAWAFTTSSPNKVLLANTPRHRLSPTTIESFDYLENIQRLRETLCNLLPSHRFWDNICELIISFTFPEYTWEELQPLTGEDIRTPRYIHHKAWKQELRPIFRPEPNRFKVIKQEEDSWPTVYLEDKKEPGIKRRKTE